MEQPQAATSPSALGYRLNELLGLTGCVALVIGLALTPESLAFDLVGALSGVADTAAVTVPAAVLVATASGVNLLVGAVLMRAVRGRPFESVVDACLWGFTGAVLLDLLLMFALGSVDLFRLPILAALHAAVLIVAYRRAPPLIRRSERDRSRRPLRLSWFAVFLALAWSPAVVLQLASPVPPFMDVLPNHTAPVEHLRAFGSFDPLTTTPSPIYGPSRTSLGFVAVLGTVTTLSGLAAALSVSAFILVEVLLVAAAAHRLGLAFGGRHAASWMLLTFALTQTFARLADDRSRVLVFPVAVVALIEFARMSRPGGRELERESWRRLAPPALALGATILFHAVIGAFVAATLLVLALLDRRHRIGDAVAVVAIGGTLALPQAAIMVGIDLPAAAGLLVLPAALLVGALLRVDVVRRAAVALTLAGGGAALLAAVLFLPLPRAARDWAAGFVHSVPIMLGFGAIGLVVARARIRPLVWSGVLVGAGAGTSAYAIPSDSGWLVLDALRFEIPKEVHSWLPVFLALVAAVGLGRLSVLVARAVAEPMARAASFAVLAAFVILATLPARFEPIDPLYTGEHRIAENMAIHLRHAERGFFTGYPDSRWVVNADQSQLLNAIRERVRDGRIGPDTRLLHVARTFRHWESTPVGTFAGVRVTTVSEDGGVTIHTAGGDLHTSGRLDALLASSDPGFPYLLLEPDTADHDEVRARILEAGYRPILANAEGELFTLRPGG